MKNGIFNNKSLEKALKEVLETGYVKEQKRLKEKERQLNSVEYNDMLRRAVRTMEDEKSYRIEGYWYTGFMLGSMWKLLILGEDAHKK